jgi:propanediol utilization protein
MSLASIPMHPEDESAILQTNAQFDTVSILSGARILVLDTVTIDLSARNKFRSMSHLDPRS